MDILDRVDRAVALAKERYSATLDVGVGSKNPSGFYDVRGYASASSKGAALKVVQLLLDEVAGGLKAFIRRAPVAETHTDFEADTVHHRGSVRFSVTDEPGEWVDVRPAATEELIGFGGPPCPPQT